mgnify:CR=1 FL=1
MQTGSPSNYRGPQEGIEFHRQVTYAFRRALGFALVIAALLAHGAAWASRGDPWILVDTEAMTLTVLSDENRVLARFDDISIGSGGTASIRRRGDQTTPLGLFRIGWIDHRSRYDIFFGLDYPSERVARGGYAEGVIGRADLDRIIEAVRRHRIPPQDTPLGGYLGIHGVGRGNLDIHRALNWTDGCVALTNRQIRQLARWVRVGTEVLIR